MSKPTSIPETEEELSEFRQWFIEKTREIERDQRALEEDRRHFERQKERLEIERRDFRREKETNQHFHEQREYVLRMKQQVLEAELRKLADEKQYLEREREELYDRTKYEQEAEQMSSDCDGPVIKGEMFFIGVQSEIALKKRYKDLIKIYHPDNLCGDTETLQEINREYDRLRMVFAAC